jgi:hypothetical protein
MRFIERELSFSRNTVNKDITELKSPTPYNISFPSTKAMQRKECGNRKKGLAFLFGKR